MSTGTPPASSPEPSRSIRWRVALALLATVAFYALVLLTLAALVAIPVGLNIARGTVSPFIAVACGTSAFVLMRALWSVRGAHTPPAPS